MGNSVTVINTNGSGSSGGSTIIINSNTSSSGGSSPIQTNQSFVIYNCAKIPFAKSTNEGLICECNNGFYWNFAAGLCYRNCSNVPNSENKTSRQNLSEC